MQRQKCRAPHALANYVPATPTIVSVQVIALLAPAATAHMMMASLRTSLRAPLCRVCGRRAVVPVWAVRQQQPTPQGPSRAAPMSGPGPRGPEPKPGPMYIPGPDGQPMEVVKVEQTSSAAWAGIAAIDRGEQGQPNTLGRIATLVAGDLTVLLLFAAIGRSSHGEPLGPVDVFLTALPFLAGWFTAAPLLGGFGADACGGDVKKAAAAAAKCWAAGIPLGLVLRSIGKGYIPGAPFIGISMATTAVFLVGWRSAIAATAAKAAPLTRAEELRRRTDKQGNPLEFLQLLMSLTKRW